MNNSDENVAESFLARLCITNLHGSVPVSAAIGFEEAFMDTSSSTINNAGAGKASAGGYGNEYTPSLAFKKTDYLRANTYRNSTAVQFYFAYRIKEDNYIIYSRDRNFHYGKCLTLTNLGYFTIGPPATNSRFTIRQGEKTLHLSDLTSDIVNVQIACKGMRLELYDKKNITESNINYTAYLVSRGGDGIATFTMQIDERNFDWL
ncbi:hypothetical protein KVQ82_03075 [Pseudomonas sp. AO-1]|uniref:hypothetical protein n=1 Tax=Pseudomonas sp. AO-1 TaxID=2855434 RepID=UPI001C741855|nr:hypothetical protein [Pseudomonas sp. AO-1]QXZ14923.1 hypothetical protein KVQ82_03075 [Pseudomonas sp. AO-1]